MKITFTNLWKQWSRKHYLFTFFQINYLRSLTITICNFSIHFYDKNKEYFDTAGQLANYFNWNDRGDFGEVQIVAESNLGPRDAWKTRSDLLQKLKDFGAEHAKELKRLR